MILKTLGVLVLVFFIISAVGGCWIARAEEACWKYEAVEAFQKYGSIGTRSEVLRVAYTEEDEDTGSNPLEVIEKEPNGCSLGSNGRTIIRFSFDARDRLTTIQVFRDYMASDYKMQLIEERTY